MKLNWAERWVVNNPSRVLQQKIELNIMKRMVPLEPGATVLEIGCGRGAGANLIRKVFMPTVLHASDLDMDMIERARNYLSASEMSALSLYVADTLHLPYRNDTLDAIFVFGVLHHVPQWQAALFEIVRILKPGGLLYFEEIYPSLYQNFITKHILLHPQKDRFRSDDLKAAFKRAHLSVKDFWELKKIGIFGVARKERQLF
jgi:ubiquinone/menaquinone biosynthesis C-methylase UbiE